MRVDMSPEAVNRRLSEMGQLWELSAALLKARAVSGAPIRRRPRQKVIIRDSIRKILVDEWDPIGVRGIPEAVDEYDSYIDRLYPMLEQRVNAQEIGDVLAGIEKEEMGVFTTDETRQRVAEQLRQVRLDLGN